MARRTTFLLAARVLSCYIALVQSNGGQGYDPLGKLRKLQMKRMMSIYSKASSGGNGIGSTDAGGNAGGPGCSSFGVGAMTEVGPFKVKEDGKTLKRNQYAWNKREAVAPAPPCGSALGAKDAYTFLVNCTSSSYIGFDSVGNVYKVVRILGVGSRLLKTMVGWVLLDRLQSLGSVLMLVLSLVRVFGDEGDRDLALFHQLSMVMKTECINGDVDFIKVIGFSVVVKTE
ncbi:hypothetical protein IFM89_032592 [Coptis chinensis]|uniref:Uncharacterized protein n=1 Tax=Coptis chinensis TaxID=261450 RepID=A0A835IS32_9MAGN|nr:hypothetical protein IFM89_032592 [Coptis chinensis]